ncbi:MAG: hypothetical protein RH917_11555 [Lacipirellulaceae bacterium]
MLAPRLLGAQAPVLLDDMGGKKPSLRVSEEGANARLLGQSVQETGGRQNSPAERIQFLAAPGSTTKVAYSLPSTPVIDELVVQVWLRCNRPGVRIAARVSLPRSINPETGKPYQLLLVGPASSQGLLWEKMKLGDLSKELARQARVARAKHGSLIDERGAILQELVFLVPGSRSGTELIVDEIAMHGVFHSSRARLDQATRRASVTRGAVDQLSRPRIPRILQWQGEPFEKVRELGFDAASLSETPAAEQLEEARQAGLFLICPPGPILSNGEPSIGSQYDGVLAWDLGEIVSNDQVDEVRGLKRQLTQRESVTDRPTLLRPKTSLRRASRSSDLLLLGSKQAGSTATLADFAQQLSGTQRHCCPGSKFWVNLNTQYAPAQVQQVSAIWAGAKNFESVGYHELLDTAFASMGCRPRGFYFESQQNLATTDRNAKKRAAAAELVNLRLGLAEPWLDSGKPGQAQTSVPGVTAVALETERSHLLIPIHWNAGATHASRNAPTIASSTISILVSGVPESIDAYLLAWDGPKRLRTQRVTGGIRVSCTNLPRDAMLLLTQDPSAIAQVGRYLQKHKGRAAKLRYDLLRYEVEDAERALAALPTIFLADSNVAAVMAQLDTLLRHSDSQRQARNYKAALASIQQAERLLNQTRENLARQMLAGIPPGEIPWPTTWSTLPATHRLRQAAARSRAPWQKVAGGSFEDLENLLSNGWRHLQHASPGLTTSVRLSGEAPSEGNYCLKLVCNAGQSQTRPAHAPTPPVWVTSPDIPLAASSMIEITGKVRVREQPLGVFGGLLIFDSLGGESSALRIRESPSWKDFHLVRLAGSSDQIDLTFALGGAGTAEIDDLQFRVTPVTRLEGPVQKLPKLRSANSGFSGRR